MKKIILFNEEESKIIEQILNTLKKYEKSDEINSIYINRIALEEITRSISLYPSIMNEQHLGKLTRTIETLIENLCMNDELDIVFHIPTKAVLGNGFLIAKVNFFSMLQYLSRELQELGGIESPIRSIISNIFFTIMAEEVFLSIIGDKEIPMHIRINAGYLIANIWEYRLDHGVKEFSPILSNIWKARETLTPTFGTMIGFSELYFISEHTEPAWLEFFQRDDLLDEEINSLEEFLFGLSYEEMMKLRLEMRKIGKACFNKNEIDDIIGKNKIYPEYEITNPRDLYRSFRHRRMNAKFRTRAKLDGPHKTIEEYIMCYLLSRPREWMK